jgi:hypothetical protein
MGAAELTILLAFLEAGIRLYEKTTEGKTPEELEAMAKDEELRTVTARAAFAKEFGGTEPPE